MGHKQLWENQICDFKTFGWCLIIKERHDGYCLIIVEYCIRVGQEQHWFVIMYRFIELIDFDVQVNCVD